MPFRITKQMIRMAEAERGFSKEVRLTQFREMAERMRWTLYRPLRRALRSTLPWDNVPETEDTFRPSSPNFLYLLAQETRNGNYSDYERFLHYLGSDVTGDAIAALDERLRITFEPHGNNRREWWKEPSHEAAEWLRRQIAKKPRSDDFIQLEPELIEPKYKHLDKRKILEPELREFVLREDLYAMLPRRQAEIMWLHVALHDKDRPRETTKAIAAFLGISPATVRWHKSEALKNPQLRARLGLSRKQLGLS
jgi:hypothetical protein